jgi:hypothetical protein
MPSLQRRHLKVWNHDIAWYGMEICKVPEDWAVADSAALYGSGLTEARRTEVALGRGIWVVLGEVWADWQTVDLLWTVDDGWIMLFYIFSDLGIHHLSWNFFFFFFSDIKIPTDKKKTGNSGTVKQEIRSPQIIKEFEILKCSNPGPPLDPKDENLPQF